MILHLPTPAILVLSAKCDKLNVEPLRPHAPSKICFRADCKALCEGDDR
jgi:hypothetical protein